MERTMNDILSSCEAQLKEYNDELEVKREKLIVKTNSEAKAIWQPFIDKKCWVVFGKSGHETCLVRPKAVKVTVCKSIAKIYVDGDVLDIDPKVGTIYYKSTKDLKGLPRKDKHPYEVPLHEASDIVEKAISAFTNKTDYQKGYAEIDDYKGGYAIHHEGECWQNTSGIVNDDWFFLGEENGFRLFNSAKHVACSTIDAKSMTEKIANRIRKAIIEPIQ